MKPISSTCRLCVVVLLPAHAAASPVQDTDWSVEARAATATLGDQPSGQLGVLAELTQVGGYAVAGVAGWITS